MEREECRKATMVTGLKLSLLLYRTNDPDSTERRRSGFVQPSAARGTTLLQMDTGRLRQQRSGAHLSIFS